MVCPVGSVKMAVMAKLLASGSLSQGVTEEGKRQKLVAQYIRQELLEADEANLLDEEDMHVFDLNPLADPLHLVCCNSCRKPVKASQFVDHEELCRSLGLAKELTLELGSGKVKRKPPRKERKKSMTVSNQMPSTGVQEKCAVVDAFKTAVCSSQLHCPAGFTSSELEEPKETLEQNSGSAAEMIPFTKHPRLVASDTVQPSDNIEAAHGVSNGMSCQEALNYVPVPLATKAYYSQRNNRLRGAISHMYHKAFVKECSSEKRESQGNHITWEACTPCSSDAQLKDQHSKMHACATPTFKDADQIFTRSSEVSLEDGGQTYNDSLNQVPVTDGYTSPTVAFGMMSAGYHPMHYSFTGNSGTPLPHIQQPSGSVHVV